MQRSKAFSLNRRNSLLQDDDLYKSMRTNSSKIPIPSSAPSQQTKKLIERLQKLAKDQKEKREDIDIKYDHFKQRVVSRQRQFYRILSKYDSKIPGDSKQDHYQSYVNEIYTNILCTFEAFNQKARSLLDDRYSEMYRLMERRIEILMQKMDKELVKYRKVSLTERKQLQESIREIGVIAAETESQNIEFRKKNQCMELKLKILNDEKRLLLEEITSLKAFIKHGVKKSQEKTNDKDEVMKGDFWKGIESIQMQKGAQDNAKNRRSLTNRQNRYQKSSKPSQNSKIFNQPIDIFKLQRQSISQQSIISHLRHQLQREKCKNSQLVKFSLELEAKQLKIMQLVASEIGSIVTKASETSQNSLLDVIESKDSECEMSDYDGRERIKIQGAAFNVKRLGDKKKLKQANVNLQINTKNLSLESTQQQLIEEQKKFSNFVSSINKILQLPQNSQLEVKSLLNKEIDISSLNQSKQIQQNPENSKKNSYHSKAYQTLIPASNFAQSPQTHTIHTTPQQSSRLASKSNSKRYQTQHRTKNTSALFVNYSPLDIMDITRSIEIN